MDFDAILIGSGQAAVPLAGRLARNGKRVLLVERGELGGTCVNSGCTPTKTIIASARAAHVARTAGRLGVRAGEVTVDLAAVVDRKDALVGKWRKAVAAELEGERLRVARGHARLVGAREIDVGGERHRADTIVIDVGARPVVPRIDGLDQVAWLDNGKLLNLRELPSHLIVIGGSFVGCELGQAFRRFGAAVTVIDHEKHLMAKEDPEASVELEAVFRKEGIDLRLGARVTRVAPAPHGADVFLDGGDTIAGSHLLVAVGRRPNTDDLGCDAAGITLNAHGFIPVDDHYKTNVEGIYAVGDVTGGPQFTHTAWDDYRLLYDVLAGHPSRPRSGRVIPRVAFTDPQVAGVGLTEREARERGIPYELATRPFRAIARAAEVDEKAGVVRILVDPSSERILGATIVGAEAGELLHSLVALMQAGASARALVDAEIAHPTFAEGLQSALMSLPRFRLD